MNNEYYGAASTPTEDFLAHYGIKGMKWGVRKAVSSGNDRALGRQFRKAEKKLAKLDKQAAKTATYKKRAISMGIGAAAAGGLAAAGTKGVGRLVGGVGTAMQEGGHGVSRLAGKYIKNGKIRNALKTAGVAVGRAGTAVKGTQSHINKWGNSTSATEAADTYLRKVAGTYGGNIARGSNKVRDAISGVSNNTLARVGAGAIGAGLAAGAARNAYKAKTAQKKAQQFRSEMNKAFAGTKYVNRTDRPSSNQKKRKNHG